MAFGEQGLIYQSPYGRVKSLIFPLKTERDDPHPQDFGAVREFGLFHGPRADLADPHSPEDGVTEHEIYRPIRTLNLVGKDEGFAAVQVPE